MKVDYIKMSNYSQINNEFSTDGNPPQDVVVDHSTGNYVKKDQTFGNVQLSRAEETLLETYVSDDLTYDDAEMKKAGEAQIDTEGLDNKGSEGSIDGATAGVFGGAALGAAAFGTTMMFTTTTSVMVGTNTFSIGAFNFSVPITEAKTTSNVPFMAAVAGGICLGVGALAKGAAGSFEPQLNLRTQIKGQADATNAIIDAQADKTVNNIGSMYNDIDEYAALSEDSVSSSEDSIESIETIQMEIMELEAAGMTKEAKEKKKELKTMQEEAAEAGEGYDEELAGITERLEIYSGENAEGLGVVQSATTVADFLKFGEEMRAQGRKCIDPLKVAELVMYGLAGLVAVVALTKTDLFSKPAAIVCAAAGAVMMAGAGKLINDAHKDLKTKIDEEAACATKGVEMANGHISVLSGVIEESEATIPTTNDEFGVISEESQAEIDEMQEESEKNLNEQADSIAEDKAAYTAEDNTSAVFNALLGNGNKTETKPVVADTSEPEAAAEPASEVA